MKKEPPGALFFCAIMRQFSILCVEITIYARLAEFMRGYNFLCASRWIYARFAGFMRE